MPDPTWNQRLSDRLAELDAGRLLRRRRVVTPIDAVRVEVDGRTLVNFASNDYLGLSHHFRVIAAAQAAIARYGVGSGAAPLITGYTDAHASAEAAIARWKGTESAVLLSSGYQANIALVQTLAASGGVRFLLDKLCHASLIDAVRAVADRDNAGDNAACSFRVYPHNHIDKLQRLLSAGNPRQQDVIVTESIFSMDGDAADLRRIVDLYQPADAGRPLLLVDEAHGSGVYGQGKSPGAGLAAEMRLGDRVDATLVTLSKALGCIGAAVCGSKVLCDALINLGRAYIFSTSMPASVAAAAEAAIGVLRDEPSRQQRLRSTARRVREELLQLGLELPNADRRADDRQPGDSPIVPILLGEEGAALAAADRLGDDGMLVLAIRPPTVPRGTSRLRITLSSEHSDDQVDLLLSSIRRHKDTLRPASAKKGSQ